MGLPRLSGAKLIAVYGLPLLAYVLWDQAPEGWLTRETSYALRLVATAAAMAWAWRWVVPLRGPRSRSASVVSGVIAGAVGTVLWIAALTPFVDPAGAEAWPPTAFALRLAGASLLVPLFEELLMRGYVFRAALLWDAARRSGDPEPLGQIFDARAIASVQPGQWSVAAVALSTVFFALGHTPSEWPAAVLYGLLMSGLWIARKDLLSCVVAHGVTNACLAVYVATSGRWELW